MRNFLNLLPFYIILNICVYIHSDEFLLSKIQRRFEVMQLLCKSLYARLSNIFGTVSRKQMNQKELNPLRAADGDAFETKR